MNKNKRDNDIGPNDEAWAIYRPFGINYNQPDYEPPGWLVDTCAGGTWSPRVENAVWFTKDTRMLDVLEPLGVLRPEVYWFVRVQ